MSDLRTAAQQALEALWHGVKRLNHRGGTVECLPLHEAITALKAALAEPVQEPDTNSVHENIRWQLCLLAQTEEFSDEVRNQIGRGVWLIDQLQSALVEPVQEPVQKPAQTFHSTVTGYGTIKGRKYINNEPVEEPVQEQCKGAPGEREFNGGCMYACAKPEPLTDTYVQNVPDKCDRIVWRGRYFHLPVNSTSEPVQEPVAIADGTFNHDCPVGTPLYTTPPQRPAEPNNKPAANTPDPYHLSRILHELAGSVSMCWEHVDRAGVFQSTQAAEFVAAAIAEIRQRMKEIPLQPPAEDQENSRTTNMNKFVNTVYHSPRYEIENLGPRVKQALAVQRGSTTSDVKDLLRRSRNLLSHPPLWWGHSESNRLALIGELDQLLRGKT